MTFSVSLSRKRKLLDADKEQKVYWRFVQTPSFRVNFVFYLLRHRETVEGSELVRWGKESPHGWHQRKVEVACQAEQRRSSPRTELRKILRRQVF